MADPVRAPAGGPRESVRIVLSGHVQGVGFRPFVYRTALAHGLAGSVLNKVGEVEIVASGNPDAVAAFRRALIDSAPPLSRPVLESVESIGEIAGDTFVIAPSSVADDARVFVPPDYFMCEDCRAELEDPADRRYRYPFINCTQCGPRYTLIREMPYDRPNTSMSAFPLCARCRAEYEDPADRRFHAEPVACPECGPALHYVSVASGESADGAEALEKALGQLRRGAVVGVKGVGGYHLLCDAGDASVVDTLRRRKRRPDKPFAVMFPLAEDDGLGDVRRAVRLTDDEAALLRSPMRPILLAKMRDAHGLAPNVAPGLAELGVFLPYSPLHQLLLAEFGSPLIATSGNISGEPVLTDNDEVDSRLAGVADALLHHDRPILRPADDPVYRCVGGVPRPLRIGRGAAPRELEIPWRLDKPVLAVGGHMKGTIALGWENRAVVSPHIGEMDSPRSMRVFESVVADLQALYGVRAEHVVCDAHPGYATARWARDGQGLPVTEVWHHSAHASALAAEFPGDEPWLVFTWDGVGYGPDGTLWGGEALIGRPGDWRRVASMRPFSLPGGERAGREPWRSAAALFWECGREWSDVPDADGLLHAAWQRGLNAPQTSAVGRLFDAASAFVCGTHRVSFEAQGPMYLEALCREPAEAISLPIEVGDDGVARSDWSPLLEMLADGALPAQRRAEAFHASMATALADQVRYLERRHKFARVGLAGGVFQNRVLTDGIQAALLDAGYEVFLGRLLPCNDAAISFGQLGEFAALDQLGTC